MVTNTDIVVVHDTFIESIIQILIKYKKAVLSQGNRAIIYCPTTVSINCIKIVRVHIGRVTFQRVKQSDTFQLGISQPLL